jgi:hypothetical protein
VGRPIGPKKVHRFSVEFKLTAVKPAWLEVVERAHAMLQQKREALEKAPSGSVPNENGNLCAQRS